MLLTITTHRPYAADLGYLLHKHPDRCQHFDLSFGRAHVYYPVADDESCSACLLLDVDPVGMARRKGRSQGLMLDEYVNDRPYVASSFMSVAISQVFGTAMGGRCKDRPELVNTPIPLTARIDVLRLRGGVTLLRQLFEPLGYSIDAQSFPLDPRFPDWGDSPYFSVTISGTKTVAELLTHIYVLIPVFDNDKHYYVAESEVEKLLAKGAGWLADHPEKELIARRYLQHRSSLYRPALARLAPETVDDTTEAEDTNAEAPERELTLNQQRHAAVLDALMQSGAKSVLDLGCGEGKFLRSLLSERQFKRIVGMDVSIQSLQRAGQRIGYDRMHAALRERVELIHGSLIYRDRRLENFDAAAVIEVIEHLDPPRLTAFERVLFEFAKPTTVVLTTPNREYNVMWETLPAEEFRHADHRFEWNRAEFQNWANTVAERFGYTVTFQTVGPVDEAVGSPTQMGVFTRV